MMTLELIAGRTGKPVSFFLSDGPHRRRPGGRDQLHNDLDRLERMCLAEDLRGVIAFGEPLVERASDPLSEARLRSYLGQAYARLRDPDPAWRHLQRARALGEQLGDELMLVELLDWEAAALALKEDPRALELAQEALRRCKILKPEPHDLTARILIHLANMHITQHDWIAAAQTYEAARAAAGRLRDPAQMAQMYDGLSTAYLELGQPFRAEEYSHKALAAYSLVQNERALVGAENNLGVLLLKQGDLDSAERHFRRALEHSEQLGYQLATAHILLSLAELYLARGKPEDAEPFVDRGMEVARQQDQRLTIAAAHELRGMVAAALKDDLKADREFTTALAGLEELNAHDRLRDCHAKYAHILDQRGETPRAVEHWKAMATSRPAALDGSRLL